MPRRTIAVVSPRNGYELMRGNTPDGWAVNPLRPRELVSLLSSPEHSVGAVVVDIREESGFRALVCERTGFQTEHESLFTNLITNAVQTVLVATVAGQGELHCEAWLKFCSFHVTSEDNLARVLDEVTQNCVARSDVIELLPSGI